MDLVGNGLGAGYGGFGGGVDFVNYISGNIFGFKVVFYEMYVKELGFLFLNMISWRKSNVLCNIYFCKLLGDILNFVVKYL